MAHSPQEAAPVQTGMSTPPQSRVDTGAMPTTPLGTPRAVAKQLGFGSGGGGGGSGGEDGFTLDELDALDWTTYDSGTPEISPTRRMLTPQRKLFEPESPMPARTRTPRFQMLPMYAMGSKSSNTPNSASSSPADQLRYLTDFEELDKLGEGEFGIVYKCRHRHDGRLYAVKHIKKSKIKTLSNAQREIDALATLSDMGNTETVINIVRYYTMWTENNGDIYVQTELCNGGCLNVGHKYSEEQLQDILTQVATGLAFIHSQKMAHMDIKPRNIFVTHHHVQTVPLSLQSRLKPKQSQETSSGRTSLSGAVETMPIYKIGDLGHMTSIENPAVKDGDVRYLAKELYRDDFSDLARTDIFALGMSIYELARQTELPKDGDEYDALRSDDIPPIPEYSAGFNALLKKMMSSKAAGRPTAQELVDMASGPDLKRQLHEERFKTAVLQRELEQHQKQQEQQLLQDGPNAVPTKRRKMQRVHTSMF